MKAKNSFSFAYRADKFENFILVENSLTEGLFVFVWGVLVGWGRGGGGGIEL